MQICERSCVSASDALKKQPVMGGLVTYEDEDIRGQSLMKRLEGRLLWNG